jgi:hypothetical protein
MLKRTLLTALAASATLAFAASAHAAYLSLGTTNTSNVTTTLTGSTVGSELLVRNTNGVSTTAFGLFGLLTTTSPTVDTAALRGANNATNGHGYGVWGSQAGSGTGVLGFAPSGRGVWGSATSGIGVRGSSSTGTGVLGTHAGTTGTSAGVRGDTHSTAANATGVYGVVASSSPGANSAGVLGVNSGTGSNGVGVYGSQAGRGAGVYGTSAGNGVYGNSSGQYGAGVFGYDLYSNGVYGQGGEEGVSGYGGQDGVYGEGGGNSNGVRGQSDYGYGVFGISSRTAIFGHSLQGSAPPNAGVWGKNDSSGFGVLAESHDGPGIYADSTNGSAGYFEGPVYITGGCTGCSGPSVLKIDDPLDPAHKYLNHASVVSPQMKDVYDGMVTTNARGFATVRLPGYFQALNRTFRYQLTVVGKTHWDAKAAVWNEIAHNRFTIRTDQPNVKVSWQVTGVRHDRFAEAHPTRVIVPKSKADQGKYVNPQVYGKPRSDGIGHHKPPRVPRTPTHKR